MRTIEPTKGAPSLPRRAAYAALGAMLSIGAPVGLLLIRLARDGLVSRARIRAELAQDVTTYAYVTFSSGTVFALFGHLLGRQADRLAELAISDPLTGLHNARALRKRLTAELRRAARYGQPLSLLLIDLDGLKAINDRLGHLAGDEALQRVAHAICRQLRASDLGARWGGDEFALLAPNTGESEAVTLAQRVRLLVATSAVASAGPALTASVGIVTFDPTRDAQPEARHLMHAADAALYRAKRTGRNKHVLGTLRPWADQRPPDLIRGPAEKS
jgi:diguanylate cyclase (GGDEF)-like protein